MIFEEYLVKIVSVKINNEIRYDYALEPSETRDDGGAKDDLCKN